MLSNMNQQPMDGIIQFSNTFYNVKPDSHSTKNDPKEFSIYRPDIDFSLNYEPVGEKSTTRLVNDAKEAATTHNGENGRKAVMTTVGFNHYDPTNLHNYSKVPQSVTTECSDRNNNNKNDLNSTTSDQEDLNRDDNNNPSNKVDDKKPEHHIRRPMNAFLIFCKRHRALVREKYPNLENRSITKILGDWWAFLPNEDKSPYKELAKNYKDVFFSKNPNFKWYKLPAPPLRTLSTRPTNDRSIVTSPSLLNGEENAESTKDRVARNIKPLQNSSSGIGQFKFASIDQMGGLTSLMAMDTNGAVRVNGAVYNDRDADREEVEPQIKKRKSEEILDLYEDQDANFVGKSHRACKGKRYEQFMTPSKKVTKQKSTNSVTPTAVHFPHNGYCKPQEPLQMKQEDSSDEMSNSVASPESDEIEQRNADAADFKLNEKIMTLPSLDLDDYLNRKKAMKKKKKFTHKAKHRQQATQAAPKDKAIPKPTVVGSQKRKAPKQTIRRTTDVNQPGISRELIGLDTLATLALVQAGSTTQ